jgi:hypothetical protein
MGGHNQLSPQARAACVSGKAFSRPDTHVRTGISSFAQGFQHPVRRSER